MRMMRWDDEGKMIFVSVHNNKVKQVKNVAINQTIAY